MSKKEAAARLKINHLLEEAGWRLFDTDTAKANVSVEIYLQPGQTVAGDTLGNDFQDTKSGFADYVLLDYNQKPLAVLEAKRESIPPLSAKEQARNYANSLHVRYVILSNGNSHYLWDMLEGNPEPISRFPSLDSLQSKKNFIPNPDRLVHENVDKHYIASSQLPGFQTHPEYLAGGDRQKEYLFANKLKIMRHYQVGAIKSIQQAAKDGKRRFLLEMATGTGKTLTCAAIIKLFLRTENARRILFLVDRLELEDQADKAFRQTLGQDYTIFTYKQHRDDWEMAEVVVTTVQSLQVNDRYKEIFSPTDFDLIISDEAHRSINGNARAVFEYFIGYRIGLTATPKDYLKGIGEEDNKTQKEFERRQLLDTYKTFGCESGEPTFRYSLTDGVNDPDGPFLVNPTIVDARTEITTKLLSTEGYAIHKTIDDSEVDTVYGARDFERRFFNERTNEVLAETFLNEADTDPISGEVGKSIIFAVSQDHAEKIVDRLNQLAVERWPGKYQSDFAIQITSRVTDAQNFTVRFSENDLLGHTRWLENYESSRARVAVTVGMMTTGYDCADLQNVVFMRPVFSPSDFIQMKGRGTRLHTFKYINYQNDEEVITTPKTGFKLIDFFAVCEFFNEKYDYQAKLAVPRLPASGSKGSTDEFTAATGGDDINSTQKQTGPVELNEDDSLASNTSILVGADGMRIDQEMFRSFKQEASNDPTLIALDKENPDAAREYLKNNLLNKASHFMTLEKVRRFFKLDRRLSLDELLDIIMDRLDTPKSKTAVIQDQFDDFIKSNTLSDIFAENPALFQLAYRLFDAYISSQAVRDAIDTGTYGNLESTGQITLSEFGELSRSNLATPIISYINDYISIDRLTV